MSIKKLENGIYIAKGSTWNTAVEPTEQIFVKTHNPPDQNRAQILNGDEFGRFMSNQRVQAEFNEMAGSLVMRGWYEGQFERFLAAVMGHYETATVESGVIKHKFRGDLQIGDIIHTIGWDEGAELKGCSSIAIKAITFNIAPGAGLEVTVDYLADTVLEDKASTWTTAKSAVSDGKGIFKLLEAAVRLGATTGNLSASDKIYPSNIVIKFERQYKTPAPGAGHAYNEQPYEDGEFLCTVQLDFPKKDTTNAAYFAAFNAVTNKKMDIVFTGATISGKSSTYKLSFYFPLMTIVEAPKYGQDTPIPTSLSLRALKADAVPGDMNEIVPYVELVNARAALTGYPAESTS